MAMNLYDENGGYQFPRELMGLFPQGQSASGLMPGAPDVAGGGDSGLGTPTAGSEGNTLTPRELNQPQPVPSLTQPSPTPVGLRQPQPAGQSSQPQDQPSAAGRTSEPSPNATNAPPRPTAPTPVSAGPPIPFTPLPSTDAGQDLTTPQASMGGGQEFPTAPQVGLRNPSIYGSNANSQLFGKAGGLMGGGLGVPGALSGGAQSETNISDLLQQLLKRAQNG